MHDAWLRISALLGAGTRAGRVYSVLGPTSAHLRFRSGMSTTLACAPAWDERRDRVGPHPRAFGRRKPANAQGSQ
jgi:hypothetical protein